MRAIDVSIRTVEAAKTLLDGYVRNLDGIRSANSIEALQLWAKPHLAHPSELGFNGDVIRTRIVADIFRQVRCSAFVETGSYRGATTILAARLLDCPVYSCELHPRSWLLTKIRTSIYARVHTYRLDSRAFLRQMAKVLPSNEVPFFYLDAHWNTDLPLKAELDLISEAWPKCVVLVDDFKVPGSPGFGFDTYNSVELSIERFSLSNASGEPCLTLFPGYRPEMAAGPRRGFVVFIRGAQHEAIELSGFPLNQLKKWEST